MVTGFRRWFEAGFGSETLPIIPPAAELTAGSTVQEHCTCAIEFRDLLISIVET